MPTDPLAGAIAAARRQFGAAAPASGNRERGFAEVGTRNSSANQTDGGSVPTGPTVPTAGEDARQHVDEIDRLAAYEERAAIMEFDGGLDRQEAERRAQEDLGISRSDSGLPRGQCE